MQLGSSPTMGSPRFTKGVSASTARSASCRASPTLPALATTVPLASAKRSVPSSWKYTLFAIAYLPMRDDSHRIERTFRFRDFQEALNFVRDVGDLAETEGHHPDNSFGWGYATISLRTKKIKGLHENDFIMASKIDRMFDHPDGRPDQQ
jgi:pterin-4a-carbinolamine dehydratase